MDNNLPFLILPCQKMQCRKFYLIVNHTLKIWIKPISSKKLHSSNIYSCLYHLLKQGNLRVGCINPVTRLDWFTISYYYHALRHSFVLTGFSQLKYSCQSRCRRFFFVVSFVLHFLYILKTTYSGVVMVHIHTSYS